MKFYEIIKTNGKYNSNNTNVEVSESQSVETNTDTTVSNKDEIVNEISDMHKTLYSDIQTLLKDYKPMEAPPGYDNTELNDDEIQDVLNTMLEFQDKYFAATPLSGELVQFFVWNIPKDIYKAHTHTKDYCLPDMMDPIYWFYLFCMKNPQEAMGKYLVQAINAMTDDEFDVISNSADEYDDM